MTEIKVTGYYYEETYEGSIPKEPTELGDNNSSSNYITLKFIAQSPYNIVHACELDLSEAELHKSSISLPK